MCIRDRDMVKMFGDFYRDFRKETALNMLNQLGIGLEDRMKTLSKGCLLYTSYFSCW